MQKIQRSVRQLYWQLTLSYVAVTVGSLLVALLILGLNIFRQIFLPNNTLTPEVWHELATEEIAPTYQAVLEQEPVDVRLIRVMLYRLGAQITSSPLLRIGAFEIGARTIGAVNVIILGPGGELLGVHRQVALPGVSIGESFDPNIMPGLSAPLEAAQRGVRTPSELISVISPDKEYVLVIPIYGDKNGEERYLGAVVVHLERIPTVSDIPTHMLILALRGSLLFLMAAGLIGAAFGGLTANRLARRFECISTATQAWSRGDFTRFIQDETGDEISEVTANLDHMAAELRDLLEQRQEMAVIEERNRLARELHDSTKQQALAASFQIGAALTLFDKEPTAARQHINEADRLVDNVRIELTDLIHELRPPSMEGRDLSDSLEAHAIEWAHQNDIALKMEVQPDQVLDLEARQTLFRVAQESLANVARHSGARRVELRMIYEADCAVLSVQDDGCGFNPGAEYPGIGLETMTERCQALGGSLTIESCPGEGTRICAHLPYRESHTSTDDAKAL